jgi:hypothetical protein
MPAKPKPKPKTKPAKPKHGSLKALAESSGIPYQTLSRWKIEGTFVHDPAALAERISRKRETAPASITEARLEKLQLESQRIKLALDIERGKFVAVDAIYQDARNIATLVREAHGRATNDLPPLLAGRTAAEVSQLLKKYFREMQTNLSKYKSAIQL